MTTFNARRSALQVGIANHLPVAKRNQDAYLPTLANVQFHVAAGEVTMLSTDRFIIVATPLGVEGMEDKRRMTVALDYWQLRLLRSWLSFMAPEHMKVRITEVGITFDADHSNELMLRNKIDPGELVGILPLLQKHFSVEAVKGSTATPNAWRPHLISHIKDVELWGVGADMTPAMFKAKSTYGIIMPTRTDVEDAARSVVEDNPGVFDPDSAEAPENVVQHPSSEKE